MNEEISALRQEIERLKERLHAQGVLIEALVFELHRDGILSARRVAADMDAARKEVELQGQLVLSRRFEELRDSIRNRAWDWDRQMVDVADPQAVLDLAKGGSRGG